VLTILLFHTSYNQSRQPAASYTLCRLSLLRVNQLVLPCSVTPHVHYSCVWDTQQEKWTLILWTVTLPQLWTKWPTRLIGKYKKSWQSSKDAFCHPLLSGPQQQTFLSTITPVERRSLYHHDCPHRHKQWALVRHKKQRKRLTNRHWNSGAAVKRLKQVVGKSCIVSFCKYNQGIQSFWTQIPTYLRPTSERLPAKH